MEPQQAVTIAEEAPRRSPRIVRQPLAPIALALIVGITADYHLSIANSLSLGLCAFALVAWLFCRVKNLSTAARCSLLIAISFAGSYWHAHSRLVAENDIGAFCSDEPKLCRVRGVVRDIVVTAKPAKPGDWNAQASESTRFELRCQQIRTTAGWIDCQGTASVSVTGSPDIHHCDSIEFFGWLGRPATAMNDGEFDYREYLKRKNILATLRAETPATVWILARSNGWSPREFCLRTYDQVSLALANYLQPRELHIAEAILLGKKTSLTKDEVVPFLESGTLHLLVVSGMHLVVLFAMIWPVTAMTRFRLMTRGILVLALLLSYSFFTGGDPPVLRAAVVVTIFLVGAIRGQPSSAINSLAAAAIVVLAIQPSSLFQGGPQLSFVAVLAILLFGSRLTKSSFLMFDSDPLVDVEREISFLTRFFQTAKDSFVISLVAWLTAAPLVMYHFHLVSPISVLLTPILSPFVTFVMALGPMTVALADIAVWLGVPTGWLMQQSLWMLREIVNLGENVPGAYTYAPSPAAWWIVGFYAILFAPWCLAQRHQVGRVYLIACLSWIGLGMISQFWKANIQSLEYHQIAVGHGNCSVLRFPTGETILYDCGSLFKQGIAERTIAPWLWHHGVQRIDAIIISHADSDHFSALAGLAKRFPIGTVLLPPQFAKSHESAVKALYADPLVRALTIRLSWEGDVIRLGDIKMSVLAPQPMAKYESDNSSSLVVHCECGGRSILMTGDLAGNGLQTLLHGKRIHCDLLASPHHGSKSSNTTQLADWATPALLVVSDSRRNGTRTIQHAFEAHGTRILSTADHGCISVTFPPEEMGVRTFLHGAQPSVGLRVEKELQGLSEAQSR